MKTIKKLLLATLIAGSMVNQASAISWNPRSWFNRNKKTVAEQLIEQNAKQRRDEQINKLKEQISKLKVVFKSLLSKNLNPKTARGLLTISVTLAALAFGTNYATGGLVYATAKTAVHASGIINLIKYLVKACPDLGISTTLKAALAQANAYAAPYMGQAAGYFTTAFAYALTKATTTASQAHNFATPYMVKAAAYLTPAVTFAVTQGSKAVAYGTQLKDTYAPLFFNVPCMPRV